MTSFLLILATLALVFINGFFVATEFALVRLRATQVSEIRARCGLRGRILAKIHNHLDAYLSACQLGITLASLALGWIGEPVMASLLEPVFDLAGIEDEAWKHGLSVSIGFFVISFLHIVVGEQAPKSMALREAEAFSLWAALPLYGFYWTTYPAIQLLNWSSINLLRLLRLNVAHHVDTAFSREELKSILLGSTLGGGLTDERRILAQFLELDRLTAADIQQPASEMVVLRADTTLEENMSLVTQTRYSRYPLMDSDNVEYIGLIHLKDIAIRELQAQETTELAEFARPIHRTRVNTPALDLLRQFRDGAPHFALVETEGGEVCGFITLDNLLESVLGRIRDEFRQSRNDWLPQDDGAFLGKGNLPIFTLERALGLSIIHEGSTKTVSGLIHDKLERLPKEGERITFEGFYLVVKKMRGPKILLLKAERTEDTCE